MLSACGSPQIGHTKMAACAGLSIEAVRWSVAVVWFASLFIVAYWVLLFRRALECDRLARGDAILLRYDE